MRRVSCLARSVAFACALVAGTIAAARRVQAERVLAAGRAEARALVRVRLWKEILAEKSDVFGLAATVTVQQHAPIFPCPYAQTGILVIVGRPAESLS